MSGDDVPGHPDDDDPGEPDAQGDEDPSLDDVVARFTTAEAALREIIVSAQALSTARNELLSAREGQAASLAKLEEARRTIRQELEAADERDVERLDATISAIETQLSSLASTILDRIDGAERSLESSQQAIADAASRVFDLATEMKAVARDMKDTANVFRAVDPERLVREVDAVAASQRGVEDRLARVETQLTMVRTLVVVTLVAVILTTIVSVAI